MKTRHIYATLLTLAALPLHAQIFNFSLRTNNQQVIDEAMSGAFVKISQSYELCDTARNEHFGRNEKDYFSIVPFIGVETERGLLFPSAALSPWDSDKDFDEYKGKYKPLVTETGLSLLGSPGKPARSINSPIAGTALTDFVSILGDSVRNANGLKVDTVPGAKSGWLIWITSGSDPADGDSVRYNSIKKDMEVPIGGEPLRIEAPNVSGTVYGGIYVTPVQTGIGQITFTLSGVLVSDDGGWVLDFPFVGAPKESNSLTPIGKSGRKGNINPLKKNRR